MVGSILALSVKPCRACQLSQGESPWHSGIVSGSSAEFVVSPEPLPLGEVDLRSKDGEGEDAPHVQQKESRRTKVCAAALYRF